MSNRLYVWEDFAKDYTGGLAFAIAEDSEHARDLIAEKMGEHVREYLGMKPLILELDVPAAFAVAGGG